MNKIEIGKAALEGKMAIEAANKVKQIAGFAEMPITTRKMHYAIELGVTLPVVERLMKSHNIEI